MTLIASILHDPTLQLVALIAVVAALADVAVGLTAALKRGSFRSDQVAVFLSTHVLSRVIPIIALGALGSALEHGSAGMPDVPGLTALVVGVKAATVAGVLAYALETLGSLQATVATNPTKPEA